MNRDGQGEDEPLDEDAELLGFADEAEIARTKEARTFLLITATASLTAWDIGWDLGAFEVVNYNRVFALGVISSVLFAFSWTSMAGPLVRTASARFATGLPAAYFAADWFLRTDSRLVVSVFFTVWLLLSPYTILLLARALGGDFFSLRVRYRWVASTIVAIVLIAGFSSGTTHDRFIECEDFARAGDFVPENCNPGSGGASDDGS